MTDNAEIVDLSEAILADINGAAWSLAFEAKRAYRIRTKQPDFADLTELKVSVVPRSETEEPENRKEDHFVFEIDIGVQRKVDLSTNAGADALLALVTELRKFWRFRRPTTYQDAICSGRSKVVLWVPDHLATNRVMTCVLRLQFEMVA